MPAACSRSHAEALGDRADTITTLEAEIVDFGFDGELIANTSAGSREAVIKQLFYMFGILRTSGNASGQIGNVRLSDVRETTEGEKKHIAYKAWLPVAWPKNDTPPTSYELVLPRDTTTLVEFDRKYDGLCGKSEHGKENFWHEWNPRAEDCSVDEADVIRNVATVTTHTEAEKKYPEYDRIWEDDRLDVTAIFTIIDSRDRPNDWAYTEARRFIRNSAEPLTDVTVRRNEPTSSFLSDTTINGNIVVGDRMRSVHVDVLVVDTITDAGSDFDERYDALSERADLLLFNGHARLGANIAVLANKGKVVANKYQLVLLNACDTFALVDRTMTDRRRALNGESADPNGTKFLDVISNARPGRADSLANVSTEVYKAAIGADAPVSYGRMIGAMPAEHVVVVYGEEDNTFFPMRSLPVAFGQEALVLENQGRRGEE
jgi:hypothetical protein